MLYLYFFSLRVYELGILIASFFNSKAKQWIDGRKNFLSTIKSQLVAGEKRIWFHCSSFGEFEQGRPVIHALKKKYPDYKIVLTFFSPSGINQGRKEPAADYIFYMPLDGLASKKFIEAVNPLAAFFVKYDYWFGYMTQLHLKKIPFYYISAIFRKEQYFFKWYGSWFLKQLKKATCFFVQDNQSGELLKANGINQVKVTGDTRFDRVVELSKNLQQLDWLELFKQEKKLIVAGSTWQPDEAILTQYINSTPHHVKMVIVPHEIKAEEISSLRAGIKRKSICYSQLSDGIVADAEVLIVDTVGMLSKIYQYANVAYIGGGYGKGIHNILEAVVHGVPVLFGPNYQKFNEATELIKLGGAFSVNNFNSAKEKLDLFLNNQEVTESVKSIQQFFIERNAGATQRIVATINI